MTNRAIFVHQRAQTHRGCPHVVRWKAWGLFRRALLGIAVLLRSIVWRVVSFKIKVSKQTTKRSSETDSSRDNDSNNKRRTMRTVFELSKGNGTKLSIDRDDFLVVSQMLFRSSGKISYSECLEQVIKVRDDDHEKRAWRLDFSGIENLSELPKEIGDLTTLNELDLSQSSIKSLPPSIGQLKNLQLLSLKKAPNLLELPEEIGNLKSLVGLVLWESNIKSLPSSVGQLKNLQTLDLRKTPNLLELPKEIGNLTSLSSLFLWEAPIKSLPSSIGQLKNLRHIFLNTPNLLEPPKEIGNIASLSVWGLGATPIKSLLSSIRQLKNLRDFCVSCARNVVVLPKEVGKMTNLNSLILAGSSIRALPSSIANLASLALLDLRGTSITTLPDTIQQLKGLRFLHGGDAIVSTQFLMKLTRSCEILGCLGLTRSLEDIHKQQLGFALACNRARFEMKKLITNTTVDRVFPKLWPQVLSHATKAFDESAEIPTIFGYSENEFSKRTPPYNFQREDAIYQLFMNDACRGLILELLVNRNATNFSTGESEPQTGMKL